MRRRVFVQSTIGAVIAGLAGFVVRPRYISGLGNARGSRLIGLHANLQRALDDASLSNETVHLAEGTHLLLEPLLVSRGIVKIVGAGPGRTTLIAAGPLAEQTESLLRLGLRGGSPVEAMITGVTFRSTAVADGRHFSGEVGIAIENARVLRIEQCSFESLDGSRVHAPARRGATEIRIS